MIPLVAIALACATPNTSVIPTTRFPEVDAPATITYELDPLVYDELDNFPPAALLDILSAGRRAQSRGWYRGASGAAIYQEMMSLSGRDDQDDVLLIQSNIRNRMDIKSNTEVALRDLEPRTRDFGFNARAAAECAAALDDALIPQGFASEDIYNDGSGAAIVDYFRRNDRITIAAHEGTLQVLLYVNGSFRDLDIDRDAGAIPLREKIIEILGT